MFFVLSKILDLFLSPLTWAMLLVALAVPIKRATRTNRVCGVVSILVLYIFSIQPISNGLIRRLEVPPTRTMQEGVTYDAVILLGGVVDDHPTEEFGPRSYNDNSERLLATYDFLRSGRAKVAVLSGGPMDVARPEVAEATVLAAQLVEWGIAADRLVLEDRSRNTHENATECTRIVHDKGWQKVLVVTSAFHMPRVLGCFRAEGLPVDAFPVDFRSFDSKRFGTNYLPRATSFNESAIALREMAGHLVYRMQGYAK